MSFLRRLWFAFRGKSCKYGFHAWDDGKLIGLERRYFKCKECPANYIVWTGEKDA